MKKIHTTVTSALLSLAFISNVNASPQQNLMEEISSATHSKSIYKTVQFIGELDENGNETWENHDTPDFTPPPPPQIILVPAPGGGMRSVQQRQPPRRPCHAVVASMPNVKYPGAALLSGYAVTPPAAQNAGFMTGCANVMFKLNPYGQPYDAHIVSENPTGYGFGQAAWEYLSRERFRAVRDNSWYGVLVQVQP